MDYENINDGIAETVLKTFRFSGFSYFYEDRKSGQRYAFADADKPVEKTIEWVAVNQLEQRLSVAKKGRGFWIARSVKEKIDAWRSGQGINLAVSPTPKDGDYIVVADKNGNEKKYQIDTQKTVLTLGTNEAVYQINTFLCNGTI